MKNAIRRLGTHSTPCGALLLLASAAGWWLDRSMFFAAWLSAWWFCLGLILGATATGWIHGLTGGGWGEALWPVIRRMQQRMPWLLLLFLPLLTGIHVIYPWSATPARWLASMEHPAFQQAWFEPAFFGARLLVYAIAWWLMARAGRVRAAGHAAICMLAYVLLTSLAAVDLLMSLVPGWTSTVFGWLSLIGQMTAGTAAATAMAALGSRAASGRKESGTPAATATTGGPTAAAAAPPRSNGPPVWRDLGNLLLMYVLVQAYLQFMQFLIIWAENLPREISWFVPRLQTGWAQVGIALVLLQFALPMLALLWRSNKDRPPRLAAIAIGMLLMQAVDAVWLTVPSVQPTGFGAWWQLPPVFAGMALVVFGPLTAPAKAAPSELLWRQEPIRG